MNLEKYLVGKGIDASETKVLENVKHAYVTPNNFYTLKEFSDYETLDFVYSNGLINSTKFFKILLKEWFNFCKVGGKVIIEMKDNNILRFSDLVKICRLVLRDKASVLLEKKEVGGGFLVLKKIKPVLENKDTIDRWTFGIITDGSKQDVLERQIDSIIAQKIPHFEIIICGDYSPKKKRSFVKHIPFEPRIAWITKKKNLICQNASYENLVITHNRFNFDSEWYQGMKEYGNYFEVMTCKMLDPLGRRAGDWLTYGRDIADRWINETGLLEYNDWDENGIINGSFYILKKSVWKKCPWDEKRVWGQAEDDFLSLKFRNEGIVPRFNPHSKVYTFPESYGEWHWKYSFNSKKLGKIHTDSTKRYLRRFIDRFFRRYLNVGFITRLNCNTYGW